LPWQPNNDERNEKVTNEGGLILPSLFAPVFKNELEYHYRYVRVNSSNKQATSDINLVGF